jgi:hypothetical protein
MARSDNDSRGVTGAAASDQSPRNREPRRPDKQTTAPQIAAASTSRLGTARRRDTSGPDTASGTQAPGGQVSPCTGVELELVTLTSSFPPQPPGVDDEQGMV